MLLNLIVDQFMNREEKRNKRTGFLVSLVVHAGLLILFIFLLAWKEPYPPLPEYGIELNLGFDAQGLGDEATEEPAKEEIVEEQEEVQEEEVIEESEETQTPEVEEISEEIEAESYEESTSDVSATDSKVAQEETKEEEKVEEKKEKPKVLVTYKSGGTSEGEKDGEGDQGDPKGSEESQNYEGTLGGGGGAQLSISGWKWEKVPDPKEDSDATGKIVFEIKVDRYGKVIGIKTLEKTVSPLVVSKYREEVLRTKFIKTGAGAAADESTGRITFIIKSS